MAREQGWEIWGRSFPRRNAIAMLLYRAEMLEMLGEVRRGCLSPYMSDSYGRVHGTSWYRFSNSVLSLFWLWSALDTGTAHLDFGHFLSGLRTTEDFVRQNEHHRPPLASARSEPRHPKGPLNPLSQPHLHNLWPHILLLMVRFHDRFLVVVW